jgi:tetratricopeptide (TPR) repeat protein
VRGNPRPARLLARPDRTVERLRVLLVICRPGGGGDVPFRSVASHLVRVSDDARQVFDLDVLRPPTFATLGKVLRAAADRGQPYDVVHSDGHGTWADLAQVGVANRRSNPLHPRPGAHGYLLFEEPGALGNVRYVDGPELGDLLVQAGVPVLVLNACRSAHAELAATPEEAAAQVEATPGDPHARVRAYGSLAQEVIAAGLAGVVAMRYTVYVVTAARFVGELYASLLAGHELGQAVSRGRQHLAEDPIREVALRPLALQDWMVPIVYEAGPLPLVARPVAGPLKITVPQAVTRRQEPEPELETKLPVPPEVGFYGRDETLLALDRKFDTRQIVLLYGYAGAGKTTTATEFAPWYQRTGGLAYQGGDGRIMFTPFTGYRPLARVLDQVGRVFGDDLSTQGIPWGVLDERQRRQVALHLLRQVPTLWIWDNVEPVAGFPEGSQSVWTPAEQDELRGFLADLQHTKAKVLLTSRRNERAWLGDLPARITLPPMPTAERVQLARAVADKRGRRLAEVTDWRPLLAYAQGNPMTVTVLVGQALRDGLRTRKQVEDFVAQLRAGEATLADDEREGRTKSLGASLGYGFTHAFSEPERAQLSLLHLFQDLVDVEALCWMGDPEAADGPVEAVRGLTIEMGMALLDRAAEVGLLTSYGRGYYAIHPALPWYFKDLFTSMCGPVDSPSALHATKAYTAAIARLGNFWWGQYANGRPGAVGMLGVEEANLLQARQLARDHGWWNLVMGPMQGLRVLYWTTGRRVEWARLVDELTPDLVDPGTDGPWPDREEQWILLTEYRVQLAWEHQQDYATAERLQRVHVAWSRERATAALATQPEALNPMQRLELRTLRVGVLQLGNLLRLQQKPACIEAYREAAELARHAQDRQGEAIASFNLARAHIEIAPVRDLDEAERYSAHGRDLLDAADHLSRARSISLLGGVHYERFREARTAGRPAAELLTHLNAALRAYHQCLDMFPATAVTDLAGVHNQLGLLYGEMGKFDTAMRHFQESILHDEVQKDRYGAGISRRNVAEALLQLGRYAEAIQWAQAALRDFRAYRDRAADQITQTQQLIADIERTRAGGGA